MLKTIILNKDATRPRRPYYAAIVGFPVNFYRATKAAALRDVQRIKDNNLQWQFEVRDLTEQA